MVNTTSTPTASPDHYVSRLSSGRPYQQRHEMRENDIWFSNHTPVQNIYTPVQKNGPSWNNQHSGHIQPINGLTSNPTRTCLTTDPGAAVPQQQPPTAEVYNIGKEISEEKNPVSVKYFTTADRPGPSSPMEHQLITMFTGSQTLHALPTLLVDKLNRTFVVDEDSKYKRCTTTAGTRSSRQLRITTRAIIDTY